ncbi:TPA: hypothetical protein ACJKJ0_004621 [Escherichia coli]
MSFEDLSKPAKNMMWAGYIFMNTTWIQNQMVYLIVLNKNKQLIDAFVKIPETVPVEFSKIRNNYWKKMFGEIKSEFLKEFEEHLSDEDVNFIEKIHKLRNMLAHAQVSMGRDYMFYCPPDDKAAGDFMHVMDITPRENSVKSYIMIIDYNNEGIFQSTSYYIEKVGVEIMGRLADMLNIPHYQIR